MIPVYIALGCNVKPCKKYLTSAIDLLQALGTITKIASLYRSNAYGVENQPDFFNSACLLNTNFLPLDLLEGLKDIEKKIGRKERFHWGPREIDLDIIFYDNEIINENELIVPHSDYKNRRFVLQPLAEIAEYFIPPGESKNLQTVLYECPDVTHVKLEIKDWYKKWK